MNCPKCSSKEYRKNGFKNNRQRYFCKKCEYNYSTIHGHGKPKEMKIKAIELYLEGLGFRAIGRILRVSNVAVLKWVRAAAEKLRSYLLKQMPKKKQYIKVMELDEMWHFIVKKNEKRGFGLPSIDQLAQ